MALKNSLNAATSVGVICGTLSALLYTASNICLRQVSHVDAVWVSAMKALPTLVIVVPIVFWLGVTGKPIFNNWRDVAWLIVTAFGVQIFGNVAFQWSLSILGLAISVPMVLGTMLVGGALIGNLVLGEPVGNQKSLAIGILIAAACVLGYSAQSEGAGSDAYAQAMDDLPAGRVVLALAGNVAAGIAYAFLGTMMRRSMRGGMPLVSTLFVLSSVGTTFLGSWALLRVEWSGMLATPMTDLLPMLWAGVFNALAFFAMAKALQQVPVLLVQMLNASQAAMAAAAGWLLFDERITTSVNVGLVLTAIGLIVAGFRRKK